MRTCSHFPQMKAAVFYYDPDGPQGIWELGISTPVQREAAYKYGHENLVLLDGTFNVSGKRLLLFIVMVIDESWKGRSPSPCLHISV